MFFKRIAACISTSILIFTIGLFWASPALAKLSDVTDPNKIEERFHNIGNIISALLPYLFTIAAMLALLFLILGGIKYMLAQGDPKQLDAAKNTITGAIIGLIIILAIGIIFFLISAVFKINVLGQLTTPAYAQIDIRQYPPFNQFDSMGQFFTGIIYFAVAAAALIFFSMIVWGGIRYLNSGGDPENVEKARNTLTGAGIGLLIVVASLVIIEVITRIFEVKSIFGK